MSILVTGALGHIGSYVIKDLIKLNNIKNIYLLDKLSNNKHNVFFDIKNKKFKFIYGDLVNKSLIKKIPKVKIVIHLASMTNAEKSFENKKELYRNNLGCFNNILSYCVKNNSKLIHISTTSIYGPQKSLVDETQKNLYPRSPYAKVKLIEEKLLKKNKKIKFITLRFGTISGFSTGMRFHTAVNKFCLNSVLKEEIPVWGKSTNLYRPYLSLKDASKTFKFIILKKFFPCEIFNVLSENKTVGQILKIIRENNFNPKIKFVKSRILNQDTYKISKFKIENAGLKLNSKIADDIRVTLKKINIS